MRPALQHPEIYQHTLLATIASNLFSDAAAFSLQPNEKGQPFRTPGGTRCVSTCDNEGFSIEWTPRKGWSFEAVRHCTVDGATATVELPIDQTHVPPSARHLLDALRDTVLEAVRGKWEDVYEREDAEKWTVDNLKDERYPVKITGVRFVRIADSDYVSVYFLADNGDFFTPKMLAADWSVARLLDWLECEKEDAERADSFDLQKEDLQHRTPVAFGGTL